MHIHHIVISVKDFERSKEFYSAFLGKPRATKWDASWKIGKSSFFISPPYSKNAEKFDKNNIGLNHLAFGLKNIRELKRFHSKLVKAKIKNSGIRNNNYSKKTIYLV